MKKIPFLQKLLLSSLHGLWLLAFSWFWLNFTFTWGDEAFIIQTSSVLKRTVLGLDSQKPDSAEFVFINVGKDKTAYLQGYDFEPYRESMMLTNRKNLTDLFRILNKYPDQYKYVLCDVFFEDPTPDDSLFKQEIEKMRNIVAASRTEVDSNGIRQLIKPIFEVNYGSAEVYTIEGGSGGAVYKFNYLNYDTLASMPLVMHKDLYESSFYKKGFLYFFNGFISFNTIVMEQKIRNYDLEVRKNYLYPDLFSLLNLLDLNEKETFDKFLKDRIIIIGDFENDRIETAFGQQSGSLVMLNAFLALREGDTYFSIGLALFLFALFTAISYRLFFYTKVIEIRWLSAYLGEGQCY